MNNFVLRTFRLGAIREGDGGMSEAAADVAELLGSCLEARHVGILGVLERKQKLHQVVEYHGPEVRGAVRIGARFLNLN